jgi:Zn-finger nucleic acid-binding protein
MTLPNETTTCIVCLKNLPDVHHPVVSDSLPLQVCRDCWREHIENFPDSIKQRLVNKDLAFWVTFFKGVKRIQVELLSAEKRPDENESPSSEEKPDELRSGKENGQCDLPSEETPRPDAPPDPKTILESRLSEAQALYRTYLEKELEAWDRQKTEMKKGRINEAIEKEIEGYKHKNGEIEKIIAQIESEIANLKNPAKKTRSDENAAEKIDPPEEDLSDKGKTKKKTSFIKSIFK